MPSITRRVKELSFVRDYVTIAVLVLLFVVVAKSVMTSVQATRCEVREVGANIEKVGANIQNP